MPRDGAIIFGDLIVAAAIADRASDPLGSIIVAGDRPAVILLGQVAELPSGRGRITLATANHVGNKPLAVLMHNGNAARIVPAAAHVDKAGVIPILTLSNPRSPNRGVRWS